MTDVFGMNNAAADVPAVQNAVDTDNEVVLHGTFSFQGVTNQLDPDNRYVILVTRRVKIRGDGDGATILAGGIVAEGGFQAAFLVDATDADIEFEALRFVEPVNAAIRVLRSGGVRIADCTIDGVVPTDFFGVLNGALGIDLRGGPFGNVAIADNRIRIGGTDADTAGGIGVIGLAASVELARNRVDETTAHGINIQNVCSRAVIERNTIVTGPIGRGGGPGQFVDALRVVGTGAYRIMDNTLDCGFENGAVLRLAATTDAEVRNNEITSSIAGGVSPDAESAGIQVRGSATSNGIIVGGNRINGRGRAAISVVHSDFDLDKPTGTDGNPRQTTFSGVDAQQFDATLATIEVGAGAIDTRINGGSGTIVDNGMGTVANGNYDPPS